MDLKEIEYCRQDVRATVGLLNVVKQEYDLHPIAPGADRMFSPASVAKSYLEELHVSHPREKVKDAEVAYGVFMQSYFGGRAECRIRNYNLKSTLRQGAFCKESVNVRILIGTGDLECPYARINDF